MIFKRFSGSKWSISKNALAVESTVSIIPLEGIEISRFAGVEIMGKLSHLDESGRAHMVDVGSKPTTRRTALASGIVMMDAETLKAIHDGSIPKGEVLAVARIAGIQAAKRTDEMIPLCHSLGLESVEVNFTRIPPNCLRIDSVVTCSGKTGVEMEALVAVSTAALTVYDMCKAIDREMVISQIQLECKSGGQSGDFSRQSSSD